MQQDSPNSTHKPRRKLLILVISVLLLAVSSLATLLILKRAATQAESASNAISATEVVKNFNSSNDITSLSATQYQKQINNSSSVSYGLSGKSYSVTVQAKASTLFVAVSKTQPNDDSAVQAQVATFMNKYGLVSANSPANPINELSYTTYAGDNAICQLQDNNPPTSSGMLRSHTLSCVDKNSIKDEYTSIEKLLAVHNKSHGAITFTKALRITKSDKNVTYSTLYLSGDKTQSSLLLLAAVNGNWEYLGDLATGDAKYSTGMYIITPELKTKIDDPKYNSVIARDIH